MTGVCGGVGFVDSVGVTVNRPFVTDFLWFRFFGSSDSGHVSMSSAENDLQENRFVFKI